MYAVGQYLLAQKSIDQAEGCLSEAIAATLPAYGLLSEIAALKKERHRALAFSGILETLSPSDGDSVFLHARRLGQAGRWQEALTRLKSLRKANPDNIDIVNSLGVAYYHTESYVDAKNEFVYALDIAPNNTDSKANLLAVDEILFGAQTDLNDSLLTSKV